MNGLNQFGNQQENQNLIQNKIQISHYTPDSALSFKESKLMVALDNSSMQDFKNLEWKFLLDENELFCNQISNGIFLIHLPAHNAGVVNLSLQTKNNTLRTNTIPFYYLPHDGRLSLAWRGLKCIPNDYSFMFGIFTKELDVSNNFLRDLSFCCHFPKLKTLIVDGNLIGDDCKFPRMERLKTLFLNKNQITNLNSFLGNAILSFPNLQRLSLLKNTCCPFFGENSSYQQYRQIVISKFPNLIHLDSQAVSQNERALFQPVYNDNLLENSRQTNLANFFNF